MSVGFLKVVAALPGTLDPDSFYAVRAGIGFDFYLTTSDGLIAHKVNSAPRVAQVRNDGATTNLNHSTAWQNIVVSGHDDQMDDDFAAGATGVICNFVGRVKCTAHIGFSIDSAANIQRPAPLLGVAVGGVLQPILGKTGYIRDTSGHEEASCTVVQYIDIPSSGDEVTIQTKRETTRTGTVTGDDGGCMILLERAV